MTSGRDAGREAAASASARGQQGKAPRNGRGPAPEPVGGPAAVAGRSEAEQHREAVVALVADFRTHAAALVDALRRQSGTPSPADGELHDFYDEDGEWVPEVTAAGRTWSVWLHDPHGDFEASDGTLVVAHLYAPDLLDAGFLLQFAQTSGRHPALIAYCGDHPFSRLHDLLDATLPGW